MCMNNLLKKIEIIKYIVYSFEKLVYILLPTQYILEQ
jgi:hypothetical protein